MVTEINGQLKKTDEKVIMPNNGITNVEIGNDGNGYARVTYLGI